MFNLGKWFRERYKNFALVTDGYNHDLLLMNSSGKDRTMMSAELVLAGFLPAKQGDAWADDGLKWQPVPVHTIPLKHDQVSAHNEENAPSSSRSLETSQNIRHLERIIT